MSEFPRDDYIRYRLEKADETLQAAHLLLQNNFLNSAVSRLYYACFYAINALLVQNGVNANTHAGVKKQFSLHFIKTGQLSTQLGKLYADLFDMRQKGDYEDFVEFDFTIVEQLYNQSKEFIEEVKSIIES